MSTSLCVLQSNRVPDVIMWLVMIGAVTFIADPFNIGCLLLTGTSSAMTKVRDPYPQAMPRNTFHNIKKNKEPLSVARPVTLTCRDARHIAGHRNHRSRPLQMPNHGSGANYLRHQH